MADGTFRSDPWRADGTATATAAGSDPQGAVLAGLREVLALATGAAPAGADETAETAAPIQGKGANLGALFADLAADLLNQLAALGSGFTNIRLDGLLQTDDGGYTAWGYLLGAAEGADAPVLTLVGDAAATQDDTGRVTLRVILRRGPGG